MQFANHPLLIEKLIIVHSTNILRTKQFDVVTVPTVKEYKFINNKCQFFNHDSVPYGYKKS
jgi:hypothetical protein